jgi:hypothetical protein
MKILKVTQTYINSVVDTDKTDAVSGTLRVLREGKMPTKRSPLFKGIDSDVVVDTWVDILEKLPSFPESLLDYEKTRLSKFGPQGGYPPFDQRRSDFEDYYHSYSGIDYSLEELEKLAERVRSDLFGPTRDLRPWSYDRILQKGVNEDKLNTSSGCPSIAKRTDKKVQARAVRDAISGKWKDYPAILGSRGQRKSDRFIFMFPFSTNLVEQSFVLSILAVIRKRKIPSFSAWEGSDAVSLALMEQGVLNTKTKASTDYSKMDKTVGKDHFRFLYMVLKPLFQSSYHVLLEQSLMHCNTIDILVEMDKLYTGEHGMPSGSGWTNLAESIVSYANLLTIEDHYGETAIKQVLGDDALMLWFSVLDDFPDVFKELSLKFGFVANPDKQRVDLKTFVYLQRFYDVGVFAYVNQIEVVAGSYPSILALNSAMNPERFHDPVKWSPSMETLRWIMILENVNQSPCFHDLINYFIKGDRDRLGLDQPGFLTNKIVQSYQIAKTITGFVPSYTQASIERGILSFAVVKYLDTIRVV